MKKILLGCILAVGALSTYAKDIRELVVTTNPPLSCQNCENKIKGNLRFEKGIKKIETNIPEQRVTVTYDADKTDPEKIEEAFGKIHYQVKVIDATANRQGECCNAPASESAKPACCGNGGACCTEKEI